MTTPIVEGLEFRPIHLPGYAIASDRSFWSCKRRGRPNQRYTVEPTWRRIKSYAGRKRSGPFVTLWDGRRSVWVSINDTFSRIFPELATT